MTSDFKITENSWLDIKPQPAQRELKPDVRMGGMAKTAFAPKPAQTTSAPTTSIAPSQDTVPIELTRFFNIDIKKADSSTLNKLQDIDKWSRDMGQSVGDRLLHLRRLESKLGVPNFYESRVEKTWKYIRMDYHIKELQKRQKAGA